MKLLVTRPDPDAGPLAALLENQGHTALVSPLMTVTNLPEALPPLDGVAALIFTSANGVRAFIAASPLRQISAYAVGDRTSSALREAGFEAVENAAGDVDSLVKLIVADRQPGAGPLIHVAGSDVAGDLVGSLERAGFAITRAVLYRTMPGILTPESVSALRDGTLDGVLLFSPKTAAIFADLVRGAGLKDRLRTVTAWCLSEAVVQALDDLPFARRLAPSIPTQDALLALLNTPVGSANSTLPTQAVPPGPKDDAMTQPPAPRAKSRKGLNRFVLYLVVIILGLLAGGLTAPLWVRDVWLTRQMAPPPPPILPPVAPEMARSLPPEMPASPPPTPRSSPPPQPTVTMVSSVPDQKIDELTQDIVILQRRLNSLEARPAADQGPLEQVIADQRSLTVALAALQTRVDEIDAGLQAAQRAAVTSHGLLLATEDLRQDLLSSASYEGPYSVLRALGGNDPKIAALLIPLARCAATGIASRIVLAQQLDGLAQSLALPPPLPQAAPWWRRLLDQVERLIVIRHVTTEATTGEPDAIARLAATDLDHGDLAGAIDRLDTIAPPDADRVRPWLDTARERLAAEQATDALATLLTARLAAPVVLETQP